MRLLLYSWNANNEKVLADNLIKMGFSVIWFRKECKHYTRDMELAMEMIQHIHAQAPEVVISFNYFPIVSMICNTCQIPYYSWVYDCPHFTLYAKQSHLSCNHIGIFDKEMVRQLKGYGVSTTYHTPLAVDAEYFNNVISDAPRTEREKYQCDISFVGSLYMDEHNYYDMLFGKECMEKRLGEEEELKSERASEHRREPILEQESVFGLVSGLEKAIRQQCFAYGKDYLKQAVLADEIDIQALEMKMEQQGLMLGEDYFAKPEDILMAAVLEKKVTVEERRILLTEIVRQFGSDKEAQNISGPMAAGHRFNLYTGSDTTDMPILHACNHGIVDYHTQMPLVFAGSKINLNISLRSIHSGIPLRVLDIMACGGFVLSNWQPEIAAYFEEGVEVVTFNSLEDCLEKIRYYLSHGQERQQIAEAGRKKVQEAFSYQSGLEKLFGV